MNINLHIERLVLDGAIPGSDRGTAIRAALEAELTRLFADAPASPGLRASTAVPALRGETIAAESVSHPPRLGAAIARSIHGAIAK